MIGNDYFIPTEDERKCAAYQYVEELPRTSTMIGNDYFIPTEDERKCAAYQYSCL